MQQENESLRVRETYPGTKAVTLDGLGVRRIIEKRKKRNKSQHGLIIKIGFDGLKIFKPVQVIEDSGVILAQRVDNLLQLLKEWQAGRNWQSPSPGFPPTPPTDP